MIQKLKSQINLETQEGIRKLGLLKRLLYFSIFVESNEYFGRVLPYGYLPKDGYLLAKVIRNDLISQGIQPSNIKPINHSRIAEENRAHYDLKHLVEAGFLEKENVITRKKRRGKRTYKLLVYRIKRTKRVFNILFNLFLDLGVREFVFFIDSDYYKSCEKILNLDGEKKKERRNIAIYRDDRYKEFIGPADKRKMHFIDKFLNSPDFLNRYRLCEKSIVDTRAWALKLRRKSSTY